MMPSRAAWNESTRRPSSKASSIVAAASSTNPPCLRVYRNLTTPVGHWLNVRLTGPEVNAVAIDAVVDVYVAGHVGEAGYRLASVKNNSPGHNTHFSVTGIGHSQGGNLPIHVGLGAVPGSPALVDVRVTCPGGYSGDTLSVATNQTIPIAL